MDDDELLKLSEVAKLINMTPEHVRRSLIEPSGGTLPAIKIGVMWRIKRSDLKIWMEHHYKISGTRAANA